MRDQTQTQTLITKLVNAGLLFEIPGQTIRYKALPPYAALLKQLEEFRNSLLIYVEKCPSNFKKSLKNSKEGFAHVLGLNDFKDFVVSVQNDIPQAMLEKPSNICE